MPNIQPKVGFSTGAVRKAVSGLVSLSPKAMDFFLGISSTIEVNCIGAVRDNILPLLDEIKLSNMKGVKDASIHSPCSDVIYDDNDASRFILNKMQEASDRLKARCVVFHPDLVKNWDIFKSYTFPMAVENMEHRKKSGKTVDDLKRVFDIVPDAKFVLDVTHCMSLDPTLKLAESFLENFGDRLIEVHLSGYTTYHDLLYQTHQTQMIEIVRHLGVPVILESRCGSLEDAKKEYEYVMKYLSGS